MNFLKNIASSPSGNATVVAVFAFLVYLKTLAPSVTFIDSGELAAVACTLGIAHPTGYPLFTLLGWFFSKLPIAGEEIVRLNIMAAFFCAVGVFFFYLLTHAILSHVVGTQKRGSKRKANDAVGIQVASACAALLLAFSETYWSQAVAIEVYSLHVVFLSIVTLSFFKAVYGEEVIRNQETRTLSVWWFVFAFTLGLSFSNHLTTIMLAPGFLFLYFSTQGIGSSAIKRIGLMAIPFFLGLTVYLYLPVRAAQSPVLNWGDPVTGWSFARHVLAKQYLVWFFSSMEVVVKQWEYFFVSLGYEHGYVGVVLALLGVAGVWRLQRNIAVTIALLFLGCIVWAINYDIHDIDSYFLLAYFAVALFAGVGFLVLFRWLHEKMNVVAQSSLLLALSLIPCIVHYERTNETKNYLVEDYTHNMFASLQPNALVFSFQWDYWVSASFYYQQVKNLRADVVVVDKELLRRSWYFRQLEKQYPWLIKNSRKEVDAFLKELYKFEHEFPYDATVIQASFVAMIRSFISQNIASRPVYVTTEIEQEFTAGMQRVPEGLALRVYADTLKHEMRSVQFAFRPFERSGRLEDALKNLYASALSAKAVFHLQSGQADSAIVSLKSALNYNSNSIEANGILRQISAKR